MTEDQDDVANMATMATNLDVGLAGDEAAQAAHDEAADRLSLSKEPGGAPVDWPRVVMSEREIAIAKRTYPTPSPTGHEPGASVLVEGGEALEPMSAVYIGYDPTGGHKPHVACVLTPSGRVDLHVTTVC